LRTRHKAAVVLPVPTPAFQMEREEEHESTTVTTTTNNMFMAAEQQRLQVPFIIGLLLVLAAFRHGTEADIISVPHRKQDNAISPSRSTYASVPTIATAVIADTAVVPSCSGGIEEEKEDGMSSLSLHSQLQRGIEQIQQPTELVDATTNRNRRFNSIVDHGGSIMSNESLMRLKYKNTEDTTTTTEMLNDAMYPPLQTPIVYRYYPRHASIAQRRSSSTGLVSRLPIVLLGPNVDHWKVVAQQLSSRGFNVIAVGPKEELFPSTTNKSTLSNSQGLQSESEVQVSSTSTSRYLEGPALVLQLLDTLKWKKIILVGCDTESAWAIQAALHLPAERIAGLIMCGNLEECKTIFVEDIPSHYQIKTTMSLDRFLHERLNCPFTIVWDGTNENDSVSSTSSESVPISISSLSSKSNPNHRRTIILGGGIAPHRRRPGIFAWIVTRFIEEQIAPVIVSIPSSSKASVTAAGSIGNTIRKSRLPPPPSSSNKDPSSAVLPVWLSSLPIWKYPSRIPVLWNVDDMFNEESMVVFGRIVATAIFYAISFKVFVFQYGNIRDILDFITSTPGLVIYKLQNHVSSIFSIIILIARLPLKIIPFRNRKLHHHDTVNATTGIIMNQSSDNEAVVSTDTDTVSTDGDCEDNENESPDAPKSDDRDLRPFFFLDHVVA
jgi:hypothetical protein